MASPKPFSIGVPTEATEIPQRRARAGRDYGPNLFLEKHPESGAPQGYLMQSYNADKWYDVPVQGYWEEGTIQKGVRKGQPTERLVGDAAEVVRQLREAAAALGIGVSIKYAAETFKSGAKKGQEVPERIVVKYLGTERKQYTKNDGAEE